MPEYGRAVATHRDPFHLDVFMRSPEGTLLHIWGRNGDADPFDNAMDLGGELDSEPIAIPRYHEQVQAGMDVFALSKPPEDPPEGPRLRRGPKILHWSWDTKGLWRGPEELPGFAATAPAAVADDDRLYVFARSVDGPIIWWLKTGSDEWNYQGALFQGPRFAVGDPVAVRRTSGQIDIYFCASLSDADPNDDNDLRVKLVVDTLKRAEDGTHSVTEHELRTGIFTFTSHALTVFSRNPIRQDVFVRADDVNTAHLTGNLVHWGKGNFGVEGQTDAGWFGPELIIAGTDRPQLDLDPVAVNRVGQADLFYRDKATGVLQRWSWDERTWAPNGTVSGTFHSTPAAVARNKDTVELVLRTGDYEVSVWSWDQGSRTWSTQRIWKASQFTQDPPNDPLAGATDDHPPDFLIVRPDDHVVLGVSAPGHAVEQTDLQVPPTLRSGGDVVLTFPPQHIAEQVSRPGETVEGAWEALLSGPTRVGLNEVVHPPLDSTEMLAAFDNRAVDPGEAVTAIELPRGLIISPETTLDQVNPVVRHPGNPVGNAGTFGVWRSRIEAGEHEGEVYLRALRAGRDEGFPVALPKSYRVLIAELCDGVETEQLPTVKRLELSCLGGTLTASGKWDTFEWDHNAVLGRDQSVRTAIKGVLYPFGHRAVWVEMSERSADEDIAVLRKTSILYITEPLKRFRAGAPPDLRNAFPFDEVEIGVGEYRDLDPPDWTKFPRPSKQSEELRGECGDLTDRIHALKDQIFLGAAVGGPGVTTELLAQGDGEGAALAVERLKLCATRERLQALIELNDELGVGTVEIETFFTPTNEGTPLRFPVRCRQADGDIHFSLSLIFVADLDLKGDFRPPFDSLSNSDVAARLQEAYTSSGGGVVDLPGVPINLLPDAPTTVTGMTGPIEAQSAVHEVRRLNIVGNRHDRGYLPSLGIPGDAQSWAAEVGMPTIRTLVGQDPMAQIAFTEGYLQNAHVDVPLRLLRSLEIDFTEMKDRAGGLAGPKMVLDQISQASGLGNADPSALLSEGASLLGFSLRDLVGATDRVPELKNIVRTGLPNEVRMIWKDVPLKRVPMFKAGTGSTVTIEVVSSGANNRSACTASNFTLQIPPGPDDPAVVNKTSLIEIDFTTVTFQQSTGNAPTVMVHISAIRFVGRLRLLDELQRAIGGFDKLPVKVDVAKDRVVARYQLPLPDVSAMSFVMSNLVFSAALTIPFGKEPVAIEIGFASRERPFTLTVLMFGGGGYVDLELDYTGLRRLEISLQFGAAIGMNFGVGKAEVHAFGGIRYALQAGSPLLTGYIQIGGSLDVLGLVSVAIELRVELAYDFDHNWLVGRATIVIDIDITLYSDSFELDSGEWVIAGGSGSHELSGPEPSPFIATQIADRTGLEAWELYRAAFTEASEP